VLSNQHESTSHQNLTPGDFKSVMSLNFSRSSSTNSLKQHQDLGSPAYTTTPYQHQNTPFREGVSRKTKSRSYSSSDESGIEDKSQISDFSMTSSKTSVTTPLSPVHEVKESPNHKMSTKSSELVDPNGVGRKGQKARRRVPQPQLLPN